MRRLLSPKDLAEAIGVSESSLKRWADAGRIRAVRTEGGHRRIPIAEAVRFIRESRQPVLRPDVLGFPDLPGADRDVPTGDALYHALREGDGRAVRGMVLARFLGGEPVASLCDGLMRDAIERLGEVWKLGDEGVFLEHRATDLCLQALAQVRSMLDTPADAPVALGGAPTGDPYILPSFMAATVLAAEGFATVNLGSDTPVTAIEHGVRHHAPRLVWVSLTAPIGLDLANQLARFGEREAGNGRVVVFGGRNHDRVPARTGALAAATMRDLAAHARAVVQASGAGDGAGNGAGSNGAYA